MIRDPLSIYGPTLTVTNGLPFWVARVEKPSPPTSSTNIDLVTAPCTYTGLIYTSRWILVAWRVSTGSFLPASASIGKNFSTAQFLACLIFRTFLPATVCWNAPAGVSFSIINSTDAWIMFMILYTVGNGSYLYQLRTRSRQVYYSPASKILDNLLWSTVFVSQLNVNVGSHLV
jgi:hypothetical protein